MKLVEVQPALGWFEDQSHHSFNHLRRVPITVHDLFLCMEKVLLDLQLFQVVALHRRLKRHALVHGQPQTEYLIVVDQRYVIELFVLEPGQLLRGQQTHGGGVLHDNFISCTTAVHEKGIHELYFTQGVEVDRLGFYIAVAGVL